MGQRLGHFRRGGETWGERDETLRVGAWRVGLRGEGGGRERIGNLGGRRTGSRMYGGRGGVSEGKGMHGFGVRAAK
jgi:hypothetical protein